MKSYSLTSMINFICVVFLLVACAPPVSPTVEAPDGGTIQPPPTVADGTIPPPPDDSLRDLACQNIFNVNLLQAFGNSAYNTDLFWTIHFNFKSFDSSGNPVGCYRLYARDLTSHSFVPIDNGGQVIEGCEAVGGMIFEETSLPFDSTGTGPVSAGVAHFDGNSHIACSFSIQALTEAAISTAIVKSGVNNLQDLLAANAVNATLHQSITDEVDRLAVSLTNHDLKTLTLVAAGQAHYNQAQPASPVLFYLPGDPGAAGCCTPIGMELPALDDEIGLFRTYLHGQLFRTSADNILLGRAIEDSLLDDYLIAILLDGPLTVQEMADWLSQIDGIVDQSDNWESKLDDLLNTDELISWLREVGLLDKWLAFLIDEGYLTEERLEEILEDAGLDISVVLDEWTDRCTYSYDAPYYWWTNFENTGAVTPTFAKWAIAAGESGIRCRTVEWAPLPPNAMSDQYTGLPFASQPMLPEVAVWTGQTRFYIGCRPDVTTGDCVSYYTGELYGVMIDPPDSKPQFD